MYWCLIMMWYSLYQCSMHLCLSLPTNIDFVFTQMINQLHCMKACLRTLCNRAREAGLLLYYRFAMGCLHVRTKSVCTTVTPTTAFHSTLEWLHVWCTGFSKRKVGVLEGSQWVHITFYFLIRVYNGHMLTLKRFSGGSKSSSELAIAGENA